MRNPPPSGTVYIGIAGGAIVRSVDGFDELVGREVALKGSAVAGGYACLESRVRRGGSHASRRERFFPNRDTHG
jgi:hypothetical protein